MSTDWISRAEVGRRSGDTAMAVTHFCRRGMPYRWSDGKVPWPDALYWSDMYRCPEMSGNWHARNLSPDPRRIRQEALERESRWHLVEEWLRRVEVGRDAASVANRAWASADRVPRVSKLVRAS